MEKMTELEKMLVRHEGKRNKPYRCSAGHMTVGVGHNTDARPLHRHMADYLAEKGELSDEMVMGILRQDIAAAEAGCKLLFPAFDTFSIARHNALVDVVFNLGISRVRKGFPSFVAAVNRGDWQRAADELKYANGLTKNKLSGYWTQLHGDPEGIDDGKLERPEEIYQMLVEG